MKTRLLFFFAMLTALNLPAKAGTGSWSRTAGSAGAYGYDYGSAVAVDNSGNVFVTGSFAGASINFGTGAMVNASAGSHDIYVVKYDPDGVALWSLSAGGTHEDFGTDIDVDAAGNCYVAGRFHSSSIDFGVGALSNAGGSGSYDGFLVKIGPGGNAIWSIRWGGGGDDMATGLFVDDSTGDAYVVGQNLGNFFARWDSAGFATLSSALPADPEDIAVDAAGNIFITGMTISDTVNFGTGDLVGLFDMFIVKYNSSATALWAQLGGSPADYDSGKGVAVDAAGNCYVVGTFLSSTFSWAGAPLTKDGTENEFILKYAPDGTALWGTTGSGTRNSLAMDVTVDAAGNSYTTGHFSQSIDFGTGVMASASSQSDLYVVKRDPYGTPLWSLRAGGSYYDFGESVDLDDAGNLCLTGNFESGSIDFGMGVHPIAGVAPDMYVVRFHSDKPDIGSVADIAGDQGGAVRLSWDASGLDLSGHYPQGTSYAIWRKIPGTLLAAGYSAIKPPDGLTLSGDDWGDYDYVMSVPATQSQAYNAVVPTLTDSTSLGNPYYTFVVSVLTQDVNTHYASDPDSGYSVDNVAPSMPFSVVALLDPGLDVSLAWDPPADPDVEFYNVYRSTTSGFIPSGANKVGTPAVTSFNDTGAVEGVPNYYRVSAVDVHGNEGSPSNEVEALAGVTSMFDVLNKWNLVSVPLTVAEYAANSLFPTATSSAYGFDNGYFTYSTLENGRGYWLKFSGGATVSHTGLPRQQDTIPVAQGWNMIGGLSDPLPAGSVGSIPGGIVTSAFFGYDGAYAPVATLDPGRGYWVKVDQPGSLVMSVLSPVPSASLIRIRDGGELPPAPPDLMTVGGMAPQEYALEQNYPNPFNPSTNIAYHLPEPGRVRLSVFSVLGEEVAVLVAGTAGEGSHEVTWDASGMPSGVYYVRLTTEAFTQVRKLVLLK